MILNDNEIIALVKEKSDNLPLWIKEAREQHTTLKALVNGDDFAKVLIHQIEHIESQTKAAARKKYSKDIRDLFVRVMGKRQNVFDANGGSEQFLIDNKKVIEDFIEQISNFKSNKSLYNYLSERYFNLADIDPNGVLMLEYQKDKTYPVYKSVNDIRFYQSNGQLVDYILFEPKLNDKIDYKEWRFVDDVRDVIVSQIGNTFSIIKSKTFTHPFGTPPVLILSDKEIVGTELRESYINQIVELAKDYARDKSVKTIYKFQNGFPIHWRLTSPCPTCKGVKANECTSCNGSGIAIRKDVTDFLSVPMPKEGQPNVVPNIAGFISPDLETLKHYNEDLTYLEHLIDDTIWGTDKSTKSDVTNETATGRFIDTQPITTALSKYSDVIEYNYNTISNWVMNFVDKTKSDKSKAVYHRSFGRRYIIESPDVLLDRYEKAKKEGDSNTVLDKMLEEYILSKFKNDSKNQELMLKKAKIEPYIHLTIEQVNTIFGNSEAQKKYIFQQFWIEADKNKDFEVLKEEFNQYFNNNKINQNESM